MNYTTPELFSVYNRPFLTTERRLKRIRRTIYSFTALSMLFLVAHVSSINAQGVDFSAEESIAKLTDGDSKEWVFKRFVTHMGQRKTCDQGESYVFATDGKLTIRQCQDQKIVETHKSWRIVQQEDLDVLLFIEAIEYELLFRDTANVELMRIRTPSHSKTAETVDKEFRHELD